jgi:5-oxoprolinase (ATP-hydrolysing) subunit A
MSGDRMGRDQFAGCVRTATVALDGFIRTGLLIRISTAQFRIEETIGSGKNMEVRTMAATRSNTKIAINCDMGESFGLYKMGDDEGLMPHITIANVACGFHASDPSVMAKTVRLAKQHNVKVGAHPSLPDLQGFGRREMKMRPEELTDCIVYQVGALKAFLEREDMQLYHIKPHGSLYGMAARLEEVAKAVADAAKVFNVPLMGMVGTLHERVYTAAGIGFISEYYADLDYDDQGMVIITREHHAFDPKRAAERALRAVKEGVAVSVSGKEVQVRADCICVHSDTPNAVELAQTVKTAVADYL